MMPKDQRAGARVDFLDLVFEMIDMRSFSNLWYWMVLAVMWSMLSHYVLGVPFDMVTRARRRGGQAMADVEDLARIQINRQLYILQVSGLWLVAANSALLTVLGVIGFVYSVQFAQALFLLILPAGIVGALGLRRAVRIQAEGLRGEALCKALARQRFMIQVIGVISIFITAVWGMYVNINVGPLLRQ